MWKSKVPSVSAVAERIAELVWKCYDGDFSEASRLIEAMGGEIRREEGLLWFRSVDGLVGAIPSREVGGDPITTFVQLGFALIGPFWFSLPHFRKAQALVNRQWEQRTKGEKGAK